MSNQKDDVQSRENNAQPTSDKRPYHAPTLRQHGSLSSQTLNVFGPPVGGSDGGAIPYSAS